MSEFTTDTTMTPLNQACADLVMLVGKAIGYNQAHHFAVLASRLRLLALDEMTGADVLNIINELHRDISVSNQALLDSIVAEQLRSP